MAAWLRLSPQALESGNLGIYTGSVSSDTKESVLTFLCLCFLAYKMGLIIVRILPVNI